MSTEVRPQLRVARRRLVAAARTLAGTPVAAMASAPGVELLPVPDRAWAVVAGGGTAGHVVPMLAVAEALEARGHDRATTVFVGSARGMEARLVPEAGFPLVLLPGRGIQRSFALANVGAVAGILVAVARAVVLLGRLRPKVVVSLGGYASVPCVVAATLWRVPVVGVSYDAVPGLATRLAARVAVANAVAFEASPLPRKVVTGTPVRQDVLSVERGRDRAKARAALGLPEDRHVLLAFGGSLGAARLNDAVLRFAAAHPDRGDLAIRHVVGTRNLREVQARAASLPRGALVYQCLGYEDHMDQAYAAADVALTRAGAVTVAELAAVGLPSVLVPLPGAPNDHQTANARSLQDVGAAIVVTDGDLTPRRLAQVLDDLLGDPARRDAMAAAAAERARPDAASRVAGVVERAARREGTT